MEFRKIVKSGNTSYVVSIPREWVKERGIKKGDLVFIQEDGDKNLIISPKEIKSLQEPKEVSINIDNMSSETLIRSIVSYYVNGYSTVEFVGKTVKDQTDRIKEKVEQLIAFEIMEYTPTKILIKDYLKIEDISFESVVRRMDFMIRAIMKEIDSAIIVLNSHKNSEDSLKNLITNAYQMDRNINRLNLLAAKIIRVAFDNTQVAQKLHLKPIELLVLHIITTTLENLADNLKNLAKEIDKDIPKAELKYVIKTYNAMMQNYEQVMKAYFTLDKKLSHEVSDFKHIIRESNEQFLNKKRDASTVRIIERIQAVESFIGIISRTIIDII